MPSEEMSLEELMQQLSSCDADRQTEVSIISYHSSALLLYMYTYD
jgi:hypothetical protein